MVFKNGLISTALAAYAANTVVGRVLDSNVDFRLSTAP